MQPGRAAPDDPLVERTRKALAEALVFLDLIEEACLQSAALVARSQVESETRRAPRGRDPMPPA
jgi:hypothetical protein